MGIGDVLKHVDATSVSKARKHDLTPEQLAQEPVYMRFTKAEMELLEEYLWAKELLPKDQILTPRVLTGWVKGIFEQQLNGLKFEAAKKVLARPNIIRK